ncbi:hypothetical protein [Sinomonas sp. P47F7]|uniref:hypothetical protein n=1 Tax=Sinomonas sp. P47F7 TaxID=3410987 RepID=UPI003BF52103
MRAVNVFILARLFFRYFVRKALSTGVLRTRLARVLLGVGVLGGIVLLSAVATAAFREMLPGRRELFLVLQISTASVVFWTFISFVFVKVLFMKSDTLVRYTLLLPVSHRERSAALALYEFVMVGATVGGLFLPIAVASLVRLGPHAVEGLLTGIVMTAASGYLVLAVVYNVVARALEAFGGSRLTHIVSLSLMASMALWYNGTSIDLIRQMSTDYLRGRIEFHVVNLFPYLHERMSWLAAVSAFLALIAVTVTLAAVTSPTRFPLRRRFVGTAVPLRGTRLWPTVTALVRRSEWWVSVAVAYVLAAMLWLAGNTGFVYAAMIPVSQGIYVYAATNPLRLMPGYARSAGSEVWHMLAGQTIATAVPAVPIVLLAMARPDAWGSVRLLAMALVSSVILTTLIALVFVAENDSPLVVFTGYAVCFVAFASIAVMVGVLQIPGPWLWIGAACSQVLAVAYSVVGMKHLMRRRRHEAIVPSG